MPAGKTALSESMSKVAHQTTISAAERKSLTFGQGSTTELHSKSNRTPSNQVCARDLPFPTNPTLEKFPDFHSSSAFKERLRIERAARYLDLNMHLGTVDGQQSIIKLTIYSIEGGGNESFELIRRHRDSWHYTGKDALFELAKFKRVWRAKGNVKYLPESQCWYVSIDAVGPGIEYMANGRTGRLCQEYPQILARLPTTRKEAQPVRIQLVFEMLPSRERNFHMRKPAALAISTGPRDTSLVKWDPEHMVFPDGSLGKLIDNFSDRNFPCFPAGGQDFSYTGFAHRQSKADSPFPMLCLTDIWPVYLDEEYFRKALQVCLLHAPHERRVKIHAGPVDNTFTDSFRRLLWPYLHPRFMEHDERNFTFWLYYPPITEADLSFIAIPSKIAFFDLSNRVNVFPLDPYARWFDLLDFVERKDNHVHGKYIAYTAPAKLVWYTPKSYLLPRQLELFINTRRMQKLSIDLPSIHSLDSSAIARPLEAKRTKLAK